MQFSLAFIALVASVSAFPLNERADLPEGVWRAPGPDDLRAPCPFMNTMANHGYFPRNGRNITFAMMETKFLEVMGLSPEMTAVLALAALTVADNKTTSTLFDIKTTLGTRDPGEVLTTTGAPYINLDQLDRHNAIEHDASLTRRDFAEGDNHNIDPVLLQRWLGASADGNYLTQEDIAAYRRARFQQQKKVNPDFTFGLQQEAVAFGEVGLVVGLFGKPLGNFKVPVPVARALFAEQRLPIAEGWKKRSIPLTLAETAVHLAYMKAEAGLFSS